MDLDDLLLGKSLKHMDEHLAELVILLKRVADNTDEMVSRARAKHVQINLGKPKQKPKPPKPT